MHFRSTAQTHAKSHARLDEIIWGSAARHVHSAFRFLRRCPSHCIRRRPRSFHERHFEHFKRSFELRITHEFYTNAMTTTLDDDLVPNTCVERGRVMCSTPLLSLTGLDHHLTNGFHERQWSPAHGLHFGGWGGVAKINLPSVSWNQTALGPRMDATLLQLQLCQLE